MPESNLVSPSAALAADAAVEEACVVARRPDERVAVPAAAAALSRGTAKRKQSGSGGSSGGSSGGGSGGSSENDCKEVSAGGGSDSQTGGVVKRGRPTSPVEMAPKPEAKAKTEAELKLKPKPKPKTELKLKPKAGPRQVCFQIMDVTPLPLGKLPMVARTAGAAERHRAQPTSTDKYVLVYGRTAEGESVHLQVKMAPGFWLRLPQKWNLANARRIGEAIKACSTTFHRRINFVGFEPHVAGNPRVDEPQRLSYAYFTFATDAAAKEVFDSMHSWDGVRKNYRYWACLLQRAKFGPALLNHLGPAIFTAHDLTDGEPDFFNRLNECLDARKPDLASYESWVTLAASVKWMPHERYFCNSDRNAVARLRDFVSVSNAVDEAPKSLMAYDIEQYSHIDAETGIRGFPQYGCPEDHIEQVSCSHRMGRTAPIFTRVLVRQAAKFRDPDDSIAKNMEIVVCETEVDLLLAWAKELRDKQVDVLTGYNTFGFDNRVMHGRAYMYWLCQAMSFTAVRGMWERARAHVPEYDAMKKRIKRFGKEEEALMRKWFRITSSDRKALRTPPVQYIVLAEVPKMTQATYNFFADAPPIDMFFFFGRVATWRVSYVANLYSTSAHGDLPQQYFTNTQLSQLCGWFILKKSQFKLKSYSLASAMKRFCKEKGKVADMPYETMFRIIERGDDELALGDVARYCGRDGEAPLFLLQAISKMVELRQLGALMRTSFSALCYRGMQLMVMNKIREALQDDYVNNSFLFEVYQYVGAKVIEPKPNFYEDPVATLDFASLYPSIMMMLNACPSTLIFVKTCQKLGIPYTVVERALAAAGKPLPAPEAAGGPNNRKKPRRFYSTGNAAGPPAKPKYVPTTSAVPGDAGKGSLRMPSTFTKGGHTLNIPLYTSDVDADHQPTFVQNFKGKKTYGVVPQMLDEMLSARKVQKRKMKKATGDARDVLNARQLVLKTACNSTYGFFGVKQGQLPLTDIAAATTAEGRRIIIDETQKVVQEQGYEVVYGDSVVGDTPLLVRVNGAIRLCCIDALHLLLPAPLRAWEAPRADKKDGPMDGLMDDDDEGHFPAAAEPDKQVIRLPANYPLFVWNERGFVRIRRIIRHSTVKAIYRVRTAAGLVDVTADHSLLTATGRKIAPTACTYGDALLHAASLRNACDVCERAPPYTLEDARAMGAAAARAPAAPLPRDIVSRPDGPGLQTFLDGYLQSGAAHVHVRARQPGPLGKYAWRAHVDVGNKCAAAGLWAVAERLGYRVTLDPCRDDRLVIRHMRPTHKPARDETVLRTVQLKSEGNEWKTPVYDLETEDHHFHVGPGRLVVHNTDSVMVLMPGKTVAEAWVTSKWLAKYITDVQFKDMETIVLEAEKVYMYYLVMPYTKKRYIGWYNEEERKKDDGSGDLLFELEYKGIELKRRDACPVLQHIMGLVLKIMMPEDGHGSIAATAPKLKAMLVRELGRIVRDEVPVRDYCRNKTAKTNYNGPSRPEHMIVFDWYNAAVKAGKMGAVAAYNQQQNEADGGDRVVNFELRHSGARFDYLVYYDPKAIKQKKKLSAHVIDPDWLLYHNHMAKNPADHYVPDRVYYVQNIAPSISALLCYHLPDIVHLFETAAVTIARQRTRGRDISKAFGPATGSPVPNDRWARNYQHTPLDWCKKVVQVAASKKRKAKKAKVDARRKANPKTFGVMKWFKEDGGSTKDDWARKKKAKASYHDMAAGGTGGTSGGKKKRKSSTKAGATAGRKKKKQKAKQEASEVSGVMKWLQK